MRCDPARTQPGGQVAFVETYRGEAKDAMGLSGTTFGVDLLVKIVPQPDQGRGRGRHAGIIFFTSCSGPPWLRCPRNEPARFWPFWKAWARPPWPLFTW